MNQGISHTLRTLCNVQYESYATCDARFQQPYNPYGAVAMTAIYS
jgi:hypothetical protein